MSTSGIQGVRRWDAVDEDGRPASILIGHTGEGHVAIGTATGSDDQATFVLLDPRLQVRFDMEMHAATHRARQELL